MASLLLIDDEAHILRAVQRLLVRSGVATLAASSGAEALALLETHAVSSVVCDFRMPLMNGVEVLAQVRARRPRVGRIIMTGQADARVLAEARANGTIHRVIDKPFVQGDLLAAVVEAQAIAQTSGDDARPGSSAGAHPQPAR